MASRSRTLLALVVFLFCLLVGLLVSWRSETLDIGLSSHAEIASEYVKQFFKKPHTPDAVNKSKYIAPGAVRIYIGIVSLRFASKTQCR
jgi:hypothetical protein